MRWMFVQRNHRTVGGDHRSRGRWRGFRFVFGSALQGLYEVGQAVFSSKMIHTACISAGSSYILLSSVSDGKCGDDDIPPQHRRDLPIPSEHHRLQSLPETHEVRQHRLRGHHEKSTYFGRCFFHGDDKDMPCGMSVGELNF